MRYTAWILLFLAAGLVHGESAEWTNAYDLYQRTQYEKSLAQLVALKEKDAAVHQLIGRNYYMLAEYKKATEALEKANELKPEDSETLLWLGRAWGRRAETASFLTAPGNATKARQFFEKSVTADPSNREAIDDLFEFYLEAPGFLGGGANKAEALAQKIAKTDPAGSHALLAQLEIHRNSYDVAEQHLRDAVQLAPYQVGRLIDLAKFLANRGRTNESDAFFEKASTVAPDSPHLLFERAATLIKTNRNPDEARRLLHQYLKSPLTPKDPSRHEAEALLKKIGA